MHHISLLFRRFSPLEKRLLAVVRRVLPAEAIDAFDAQVAAINRVQRLPHWTEIHFYRMRSGKVDWSHVALFPRTSEFALAEVYFRSGGRSYKARLSAVGGHIFDFTITPGGRDAAFLPWEGEPRTELLESPLDVGASRPDEPLPGGWSEFLASAEGAAGSGWILHDKESAYRVTLEEGEFVVLAERAGDEFLLYRLAPAPRDFFVQVGHDGRRTRLDRNLREWLSSQEDSAP